MVRVAVALACAVCLTSAAIAQGLPQSVADPYRAYQAAMEAENDAAAIEPARLAWQAAESAQIDAETIGLLADNYAALASAAGQHAQAAAAFARSAEILTGTEGGSLLTAQTWRLAARASYAAGEESSTERYSRRALDILGNLPQSAEVQAERFQTEAVLAYLDYDRGNARAAGRHAEDAISALLQVGPVANMDTANMAFFAGVKNAINDDHDASGFYFSLASYMFDAAGGDADTRRIARAWAYYARTTMDAEARVEMVRRLDASGFRPAECEGEDGGCGLYDDDRVEYPEGAVVEDASPLQRREPRYPETMAYNGLEGIALIRFAVSAEGRTEDVEILYSVPHSDFGEAGADAVARWRYTPLRVDGVATRRDGIITQFVYQLSDE